MTSNDLLYVYKNYQVGQRIVIDKYVSADRMVKTEVTIIGIYPNICLVTDGKLKWCVSWKDVYIDKV